MSPRLLSLLSQVEKALEIQGSTEVTQAKQRSVNYHKGLACLAFANGSSISIQSFTLADGQLCVKASFRWPGTDVVGVHSVFPHGARHDWETSADNIAQVFLEGPKTVQAVPAGGMADVPMAATA